MGGWLALLLVRELARRGRPADAQGAAQVAGLVLIAPAVDFTEELMWKRFPPEVRRELEDKGAWARPSQYSEEPYLITRRLIEEGREHLLLGGMIETGCPVRILQGVQDPDVPWQHAVELSARFARDDVVLTLVKDGDHRLSRPEDIERLIARSGGVLSRPVNLHRLLRCHARVSGHPVTTGQAFLRGVSHSRLDKRVRCLLGAGSRSSGRSPELLG